jgi:hypothetical protein
MGEEKAAAVFGGDVGNRIPAAQRALQEGERIDDPARLFGVNLARTKGRG